MNAWTEVDAVIAARGGRKAVFKQEVTIYDVIARLEDLEGTLVCAQTTKPTKPALLNLISQAHECLAGDPDAREPLNRRTLKDLIESLSAPGVRPTCGREP